MALYFVRLKNGHVTATIFSDVDSAKKLATTVSSIKQEYVDVIMVEEELVDRVQFKLPKPPRPTRKRWYNKFMPQSEKDEE